MEIYNKNLKSKGIRVSAKENKKEVGRAFLYIIKNDSRDEPYGLLEDLFVDESRRGKGVGTKLINEIIRLAKNNNCYKIVATVRYKNENVHRLYKKIGFEDFGKEFKMYLNK